MKQEIADRWVEALRSGKYKQEQGALRFGNKFCCLGVLCDISKRDGWVINSYLGQTSHLPYEVQAWADLDSDDGRIPSQAGTLAYLNDSGKSFVEIADVIEKHWEEL